MASSSSTAPMQSASINQEDTVPSKDRRKTMPLRLYKAALRGDWDETREILIELDPEGEAIADINSGDRVLHIAVGTGKAIPYLRNLVNYMSLASLALRNASGERALDVAARRGNVAAVRILLDKCPDMVSEEMYGIPLVVKAAKSGHRPTMRRLLHGTDHPFSGS